jgi:hypothetical protein
MFTQKSATWILVTLE